MDTVKHYSREGLTVIWQPAMCQHSKRCWKELLDVFDPRKHPWVNMEGASLERIREQVERCPSGALSYTTDTPVGGEERE